MKRFRWTVICLISLGLVFAVLTNVLWAKNEKAKKEEVAPKVSIISPQNGATVNGNSLPVVVNFGPKESGLGNVQTLKLKLDGKLVAMHNNPVNIKEGTYTFTLDISNLTIGNHTIQALAYLAAEQGGHEGTSEVITFAFGIPGGDIHEEILKMEGAFTAGSWEDLTQAAAALMEIGKPVIPQLLIAFKDSSKNDVLRKMYAEILGEIKDSSAVEPLVEVLKNPDETEFIRAEAASALGEIGDSTATQSLIQALADKSERIRSMAALSLGQLGDNRAVAPLLNTLNDRSETVRIRVGKGLAQLKAEEALEPFISLLNKDPKESVRGLAALWLGDLEDSRAVVPLIEALKDQNEYIACNAAIALGMIGDASAVDPLIEALKSKGLLRQDAAEALAKIGDQRAVEPLREAIETETDTWGKEKLKEAYKKLTGEEYQ